MIAEALLGELKQEAENTRRVLQRVPENKLSWKPHPKSMSLGQLAMHVANVPGAIADLVAVDSRELPTVPRPEAKSSAELMSALESSIGTASAKVGAWSDQDLMQTFSLTNNGRTVMAMPRIAMIRAVMLNHWYQHRGQLMVYLRLLDVPVPAIYGASADEAPPAFA
jgi:uncharacterized damage-inducible protein DinB